ncbi:hypothetical protein [Rhizobium leguminosarum]|uniref:hypothetical protein n=2 Tax=Rhizobium/Agrobacterium group TaxID=227290 RepID=UPI001FE17144|nr:hypothetical protein [Rhizobium leguminosarum]
MAQTTVPSLEQLEDAVDIADVKMHCQVPWTSRNKLLTAFCAAVALPATAFAMDSAQLISALERFNDGNGAQQIAIKLAGLVEKADKIGLNTLSKQIQAEDGLLLSDLAGVAELGGAEQRKVALAMRPCQTANVLIKAIAIAIGDGRAQPMVRGGTVMIDGTEMGFQFRGTHVEVRDPQPIAAYQSAPNV